jgi:3-deoxy-7-phosphoheptulonate synthase
MDDGAHHPQRRLNDASTRAAQDRCQFRMSVKLFPEVLAMAVDTMTVVDIEIERQRLDELDEQIIALLHRRRDVSRGIQRRRLTLGGPPLVAGREAEIVHRYRSGLGIDGESTATAILRLCRGPGHPALAKWLRLPAAQQPLWPDRNAARAVVTRLESCPPLVSAADCDRLRAKLGAVARGEAFLLQAGDCAETFADARSETVAGKLRVIMRMALAVRQALGAEPVIVGRLAGQYAKPRSELTETRDGVSLPVYRGDAINGQNFDGSARMPDPGRLLTAYDSSAAVLGYVRDFVDSGGTRPEEILADLAEFAVAFPRYAALVSELTGVPPSPVADSIFTSHEALLLDYEAALLRPVPGTGRMYGSSAHLLWIGDRTRRVDGAHIELAGQIANPIAVKLGPTTTPEAALALAHRLNPDGEPGRLTFVVRMGAAHVRTLLAPIVARVTASRVEVGWVCDPMHGNTRRAADGRKTRHLADVVDEVRGFFEVHRALGTWAGGLHLELAGEHVTECLGGSEEVREAHLPQRYETACDPRLNPAQTLDLMAQLTELVRDHSRVA